MQLHKPQGVNLFEQKKNGHYIFRHHILVELHPVVVEMVCIHFFTKHLNKNIEIMFICI